jgi:uncharacterized protein (TIGR02452 family)
MAAETVAILERGRYALPDGRVVDLSADLAACLAGTRAYLPEELAAIRDRLPSGAEGPEATIEAANETTLAGAARLVGTGAFRRVGVLNFASAKNPGGGFLGGSEAQEESLARSSGLYASLLCCREHYDFHRHQHDCLYSDRMIHSPGCPVFRDDAGNLLAEPYRVDFLSSPAPNAGAVLRNEPDSAGRLGAVLMERSGKLLALAAHVGCDALVLGAWGCGVFRNDPRQVAAAFASHFGPDQPLRRRFAAVRFSILDGGEGQPVLAAFRERLCVGGG